ncbi:MAG: PTS sugar transporter subunit IIB [Peptoniphilaceae bacterium]|nr:PTS sugar transporter subunit IIB [Peptoniphilaceae bacterium]MDD7434490.1 PTS sugar transporter subunit IIB [Peptoniphilaceae bacterium]MDY3076477.1 PTS sugar transporter subunit IIB [Peptoniphilaceae bacterium]
MKTVRVLVACGSGVATSTIAQEMIAQLAKDNQIPITISKSTISEVPTKQAEVDVIFTTSNYRKPLNKPYLSVFGLISGINKDKAEKDVVRILQEISQEN